jgi:hypothetical protein
MAMPMFVSEALRSIHSQTGRTDLVEKIRTHITDLEYKCFKSNVRVLELEQELNKCYEAATRRAARPVWRRMLDSIRGF